MSDAPFGPADTARLLERLVRIPSLSRDEARAAEFFAEALMARGFEARIDAAGNVVAAIGAGPRTIALVGHIDTVPGDLPVLVEDGVLHGRGSVDAKGPLVCLAAAAHRAAASGAEARLVVVACVEEEAPSSRGAHHLLDGGGDAAFAAPPDALIVGEPSGWDGVTLGYKGYLRASLELEVGSRHGAHAGATAPELACAAWRRIEADAEAFNEGREALFERLLPALSAFRSTHDGIADRARLELAYRLPRDLAPADAERRLRALVPEATAAIAGAMPAWAGPRTSPVARALGRAVLEAGGRPRYLHKTGTADLNLLAPAWGCPAVAYGPGDAALDHTPEERIDLAEVERAVGVLASALASLSRG